jgi:hypothetical protein
MTGPTRTYRAHVAAFRVGADARVGTINLIPAAQAAGIPALSARAGQAPGRKRKVVIAGLPLAIS